MQLKARTALDYVADIETTIVKHIPARQSTLWTGRHGSQMNNWNPPLHYWNSHLSSIMHGLPCPSFGHCFGSTADPNTDLSLESHNDRNPKPGPVTAQPEASLSQELSQRTMGCFLTQDTDGSHTLTDPQDKADRQIGLHMPSGGDVDDDDDDDVDEKEEDSSAKLQFKYSHIPRPSIIVRQPKETAPSRGDTEDGPLSDPRDAGLSLSPGRSVMAEPDYMEGDCNDLIKPKKLINPVKNSRNHQDLHRELLMNQKRGLAPQNKPELQKVLEKRKREQVLKAQKEEQEAHKKRSDLEIELMKRQQKLEQLELEQQKNEEEQENTPEFVKMKSNLRRTKQETNDEERTT